MSGAVISDCERYRYSLERDLPPWRSDWPGIGTVLFVMLNPSRADAELDDPTIRRCIAFGSSWNFRRLTVANVYALRSTNPGKLGLVEDPVGPLCDYWLERLAREANEVVVAWGASWPITDERLHRVLELLVPADVQCLGLTRDGHPRHPLYLKRDTQRRAFP